MGSVIDKHRTEDDLHCTRGLVDGSFGEERRV
jgi:hypothetical protein